MFRLWQVFRLPALSCPDVIVIADKVTHATHKFQILPKTSIFLMEPPLLYLKDTQLSFGGAPLLTGAGFSVMPRDRLCLVGRNGSGKSTLLKIAAGHIEPDSGERFVQPGTNWRYLPQEPDTDGFDTIAEYCQAGLGHEFGSGDDPHRINRLAEALGLDPGQKIKNLSGGEFRRAALVRTLAPEPDILLLDEPTNHLDLPAIEWLENELASLRSAIVMISHDRRFLEALSKRTIWVDRGKCRIRQKGYAGFEDWREQIYEEEELAAHKLSRKIAREEHWITHGVSGRRKRNMRRVRELATLREKKATELARPDKMMMADNEAEKSGRLVAKLKNVSKKLGERQIVNSLSMIISRGDRLGIVGPNGAGKTTLVRLITGELVPDSGSVRLGVNLEPLLIDQKRDALKPDWTLKQALTDGAGDMVSVGSATRHVISYMKDYLFLPEQAGTPVSVLSGGERARLLLARGLRQPSNLLILDEPTNDLDLESLDLLQEYLAEYQGTVILVSHDRDFLDRVTTQIIATDGDGQWQLYAGGYSDMVAQKGEGVRARKIQKPQPTKEKPAQKQAPKRQNTQKLGFKQKHRLEQLPDEIEKLQDEIAKLKTALADPDLYARDPKKFANYAKALEARQTGLAEAETEWLELELLAEQVNAKD